MKTLYLDCGMGTAGDMLSAALLELIEDRATLIDALNASGIPDVIYVLKKVTKCGIQGTHLCVKVHGKEEPEHVHRHSLHGMHDIEHIVSQFRVSKKVKNDILKIYALIADAESQVHGVPVDEIHFHEVGSLDAIADIAAVCLMMERLDVDQVIVSPIRTGSGTVRCEHGILPVPAPATAILLKDMPIFSGEIKGELCTPTGAALIRYFATSFGEMPVMQVKSIGYGMGMKDFGTVNCVRAFLGETQEDVQYIAELTCNLDDMTPEAIGFAKERFFEAGALDVYTVAAQMKKSRPGVLLTVMCTKQDRDEMIRLIFMHTSTLGIRENISRRYRLTRSVQTVSTKWGDVRMKVSTGYGVQKEKFEYDDLARIAKEQDMSLEQIKKEIKRL